jgi:hypothetical protein
LSIDVFVNEALRCVREAAKEDLTLRLLGGIPIYLRSRDYAALWSSLRREVFSDIDFLSYSRFAKRIPKFFGRMGYAYQEDPPLVQRRFPNAFD